MDVKGMTYRVFRVLDFNIFAQQDLRILQQVRDVVTTRKNYVTKLKVVVLKYCCKFIILCSFQ